MARIERKDGGVYIHPTQRMPDGAPPLPSIEAFKQADQEALARRVKQSNPGPKRGADFPDHGQDPALGG